MAIHTKLNLDQLVALGAQAQLDVVGAEPVKEGLRNSNYILRLRSGDRNILRVCDDQSIGQASQVLRLMQHMYSQGLSVQRPIPFNDQPVGVHEDKPVMLLEYLSGEPISELSSNQLRQLGQAMAQMHQLEVPDFLSKVHPFGFEEYQAKFSLVEHDYINWFKDRMKHFAEMIPEDLPKGIVHGDLWYDNAIYSNGALAGIIDFESAFHGPCIFDLGQTAIGACRDEDSLDFKKVRSLVEGYQELRPLEGREKELLGSAASCAAAVISIWRFDYFNLRNNFLNNERYLEAVNLSDSLGKLSSNKFMEEVFGQ
jgi:homoserine kinase type II